MYEKKGMYFADWRDKKGVRHRKSFATAEAALLYEAAQKPKRLGKTGGRPVLPWRPESSNIESRLALITDGLHALWSELVAVCDHLNSLPESSASSTATSKTQTTISPERTAPTPSAGSCASSKTMVPQALRTKSSPSTSQGRAMSPRRKQSGNVS
jgi:hypothetical protein